MSPLYLLLSACYLMLSHVISCHSQCPFLHICCQYSLKIFLFIFNWLMIGLQYCFDFCHSSTWINHRCTYVPPSWVSLPPPAHPHPPLSHTANSHWLSIYICWCIYFYATLSIYLALSLFFPTLVHKSVLRVWVSIAALWRFISTILLDSIYMCQYMIFVFFFLTYFTLYNRL